MTDVGNIQAGAVGIAEVAPRPRVQVVPLKGLPIVAAVVAFVILAAVVYFAVVMPYTRAKERFFPADTPGEAEELAVLKQIRDSLQSR